MGASRGITLLELLVIIGILLGLAGLGIYVVTGALSSARAVECNNHLKLQGVAWQQTVAATPITGIPGLKGNAMPKVQDADGSTWIDKIKNQGLSYPASFICPLAARSDVPSYGMNPLVGAKWSYVRNFFEGFLLMPGETRPCNIELVRTPGNVALIVESATITAATAGLPATDWTADPDAGWMPYVAFPFTDTTSKTNGRTFDYGYDWGNAAPGNGRGSMVWDGYVRPYTRHPTSRCGTLFVDGTVRQIELERLVGAQWNSAECLFGEQ